MKNLKYTLLIIILYSLVTGITSCKTEEPEEPIIDRGKKAETDAEAMQMIVGEWKYVDDKEFPNPSESRFRGFYNNKKMRFGASNDIEFNGPIDSLGEEEIVINFEDSVVYNINGNTLTASDIGENRNEFFGTYDHEIEIYENVLVFDNREYEKL